MTALRSYGVAAAGAALLVIGIVLVTTQPMSFGWTAYAPLTDVTFVPPFPTPAMWLGGILAVTGLALLAGWVGFRLGRRARHPLRAGE
jgi:heme/copper-type cytochrome/quinol oxidase subunit 1